MRLQMTDKATDNVAMGIVCHASRGPAILGYGEDERKEGADRSPDHSKIVNKQQSYMIHSSVPHV